jgi:4-amino-4-deoxy-L-arabinose transferase
MISVPWQIWIFTQFPSEAKASYDNNINHVLMPLDGHGGTFAYHFSMAPQVFGLLIPIMVFPGFYFFYKKSAFPSMATNFIITILIVFLFFSFTATKMPSFTTVVIMPVYIAAAFFMDFLFRNIMAWRLSKAAGQLMVFLILAIVAFCRIDAVALDKRHNLFTHTDQRSITLTRNRNIFKQLKLPPNAVVFNIPGRHYVESMFYTGLPSYSIIPDEKNYIELKKKKRIIAMFKKDHETVPDYLKNDPELILIDISMQKGD